MSKTTALTTTKQALPAVTRESVRRYALGSKAANTVRVYGAAWREFEAWATRHGAVPLPAQPETVIAYLVAAAESGQKASTIGVKRAAISSAHRLAKLPDPTTSEDVKMIMAGIRREKKTAPSKKAPVTVGELPAMLATLPDTLAGKRDRAILLVGFAGAFRRSELVGLEIADVRLNGELKIIVRQSKTDQEGAGLVKVIPALKDKALCPVEALRAWLDASGITSGAVFRQVDRWGHMREHRLTAQSVALVVKHCALAAGLDWRQMSGHSLRSGFITSAAAAGAHEADIMAVSGHKDLRVMRGYIQDAGLGARRAVNAAFDQGK